MNDPRWPEIERLLSAALELEEHEVDAFLTKSCAGDTELRKRVEALLDSHRLCDPVFPDSDAPGDGEEGAFTGAGTLGKYRILHKIGEGGMATVFLAEHTELKNKVALKVLPRFATSSKERVERFKTEAITVAKLRHPGIVAVHDVGLDGGVHFLVMNFIEGPTYGQYLQEARTLNRDSDGKHIANANYVHQQCGWIAKIADALHHAHQHGIVHRDVKPSNILLRGGEEPLLTDFGVAKNLLEPSNTRTGQLAGTVPYMSPEQARALRDTIDPRSDVFSLGVVLYEALTLRQPFMGETIEESVQNVLFRHPAKVNQLNSSVPRDLVTICHMALEKDPQHRYSSAAHMAGDLQSFLAGRPILASPPSYARRCREFVRRQQVAVLATVTLILAVTLAAITISYDSYRSATKGHIHVISSTPVSSVVATRLNDETRMFGDEQFLGETPTDKYLLPGHYRITVTDPGGGVREASVIARSGVDQEIELRSSAHLRSVEDMVRIEGGMAKDGTMVASFDIDRCEVSNRDYQKFVQETGYEQPKFWQLFGYPEEYPNHPVVSMSWEGTQAYARWAGLRLPTAREWQFAMTQPDGRELPWGEGEGVEFTPPDGTRPNQLDESYLRDAFLYYLANTVPVDQDEHPSPLGLMHGASNVREYTDTTFTSIGAVTRGASWLSDPAQYNSFSESMSPLMTDSTDGGIQPAWSYSTGFRCASSTFQPL